MNTPNDVLPNNGEDTVVFTNLNFTLIMKKRGDEEIDAKSSIDISLPDDQALTETQRRELLRRVTGMISGFIKANYPGVHVETKIF